MIGRRAALLAALTMLSMSLASVPAAGLHQAEFTWHTDDGFRGDLAYRVEIDPGTSNSCTIQFQFGGPTTDDPTLRWWISSASLGISMSDQEYQPTHVRVGPIEYARPGEPQPFIWWNNVTVDGQFSEPFTFTVAGFDVKNFHHPMPGGGSHLHPGAGLVVDCQDPATVTPLSGGHDVLAITEEDATAELHTDNGGYGGSTPYGEASVHTPPSISATFDTDSAVVAYDVTARNGAGATVGHLEHPDGTRTFRHFSGLYGAGGDHVRFLGEGGSYSLSLLHAGIGEEEGVHGILAGLDPLASLEDLA